MPLLVGLALTLCVAAVMSYWRQRTGLGARLGLLAIRLTALSILLAILLGPTRMIPGVQADRLGTIMLVLDTSASMQEADAPGGTTRLASLATRWFDARTRLHLE